MVGLAGSWTIPSAATGAGVPYNGSASFQRNLDVWRGDWTISLPGAASQNGLGLDAGQGTVALARSTTPFPIGIVTYQIGPNGTLDARWYHPSLQGNQAGTGHATGGVPGVLPGQYRITYSSPTTMQDGVYDLLIASNGQAYALIWKSPGSSNTPVFVGIGLPVAGGLAAAWFPPSAAQHTPSIIVLSVQEHASAPIAEGVSAAAGDTTGGFERLIRSNWRNGDS